MWIIMAYIVMACITMVNMIIGYIVMAYIVMACIVMAYMIIGYIVMACIAMANIVMAYIHMAHIVMACIAMAYIVIADILMAKPDARAACARQPSTSAPQGHATGHRGACARVFVYRALMHRGSTMLLTVHMMVDERCWRTFILRRVLVAITI